VIQPVPGPGHYVSWFAPQFDQRAASGGPCSDELYIGQEACFWPHLSGGMFVVGLA